MDNDERQLGERFGDVLDGLKAMAADIKRQKFPGQAWPVRKRRSLRIILWPAIAAVAAAAVAIAVLALHNPSGNQMGPIAGTGQTPPAVESMVDNTAEYDLHVLEIIAAGSAPSDEQLIIESEDFWQPASQTPASHSSSGLKL